MNPMTLPKRTFSMTRRPQSPSAADLSAPPMLSLPVVLNEALPHHVREAVEEGWRASNRGTFAYLEEIRLRAGRDASLTVGGRNILLPLRMTAAELFAILTKMCGGSLYAYTDSINEGYLTLAGGVRVGVVGQAACENRRVIGVREITSLCIRIPRPITRVGGEINRIFRQMRGESGAPKGILLYAPPGVGKTTLLRGVITYLAGGDDPLRTVAVDTRGELMLDGERGLCLDVLMGYPRPLGVSIATRSLGAQVIVCDEIGDCDEAMALVSAYNGGVPLIATAHGSEVSEILRRTGIRLLHEARLFGIYVGLRRDGRGGFIYDMKTWEDADFAL